MIHRFAAIAVLAVVSGCTTLSQHPSDANFHAYEKRVEKIASIDSWIIQGRIGYRAGNEGGTGTLIWKRSKDKHDIQLLAGLGKTQFIVRQDSDGAELIDSRGNLFYGKSATDLLSERTGWYMPFQEMIDWVVGKSNSPEINSIRVNSNGNPLNLKESGWTIKYSRYKKVGNLSLPSRLRIRSDFKVKFFNSNNKTDNEESVEIKLAIRQWGIQ